VFNHGLDCYLQQKFQEAVKAFNEVVKSNPDDQTAQFFLEKAARCLSAGVPKNWSGVLEMSSK
jgi:TolA-binding protein